MDFQSFFTFKKYLCKCIVFFTILAYPAVSLDPNYEACQPKSCGNGPEISYPFWIADEQESFCGYPNFEVSCNDENPVLTISSDDYIIQDIFYANHSFLVANSAAYDEGCPTPLHNLNLARTPFALSPGYVNFSFFYNCSEKPPPFTYPLGCANSFASFHKEALEGMNFSSKSCDKWVNAPIASRSDTASLLQMNYTDVLKMGFVLSWTAHSCISCEGSGGRCGFDNKEFVCFCPRGSHPKMCSTHGGINWRVKILIGVVAGLVGILATCIAFYLCQRHRKKQNAPPFLLSRNISSDLPSVADVEKQTSCYGVSLFTYAELEEATNNFDSARELGDGGFGTVYYGKLRDGRAVAVKRLFENNCKRVEQFMNEVEILTRLRHQHLVSLYGSTSRHSRELLLVYEYVPKGTVADHLHGEHAKPGALPWPIRLKIATETASALTYLHATDIIHRDVKTNNILLDNNFSVKVADFGLSRLFPTDVTHVSTAPQGTPGYVDPEYHQCYQLTDKSDVFSFGVVLIELISSKPAVDITRHRHEINLSNMAINKIQNHALHELVDPSLGFESDSKVREMITAVAELAFQCLQNEKDMRPNMIEVLQCLTRIQSEGYNTENAEEMDVPSDDVVLLKSGPLPVSPDSVTVKWVSRSTTSDASN